MKKIIISVLLIGSLSCSGNNNTSISINRWEFLTEDSRPEILYEKKHTWKSINAMPKSRPSLLSDPDKSYVWIRGKFFVKGDPSRFYGISTGSINDITEVIINITAVPEHINKIFINRHFSVSYLIPHNSIRPGDNDIYVRISAANCCEEVMLSKILIMTERDFEINQFYSIILFVMAPFSMMILYLGLLALNVIIFFIYIRGRYFLYCALLTFLSILLILSISMPYRFTGRYVTIPVLYIAMVAILPLCCITYTLFIQSLYNVFMSIFTRIGLAFSLIYYISIPVFTYQGAGDETVLIAINLYVIIMIISLSVLTFKLNSIKPDNVKLSLILILLAILLASFMIEDFIFMYRVINPGLIFAYTLIPTSIIFMVLLSRESLKAWSELERLYEKLKFSNSSMKKNGVDSGLSITEISELKLKKVIEFINENYKSDISREGLAAAIDLSPNYMGRLFLSYKQKTINEYINYLRIRDSIEKLKKKDEKILTIALDIGYDSLSTFNRAFKKVTGKTPSDYRNEL